MVKIIESLILVAPGVCFALWPRIFWGFLWSRWLWIREPTRAELLFCRVCGVVIAITGLVMAQLYIW